MMKAEWSFAMKIVPLLQIRKSVESLFVLHVNLLSTLSYPCVAPALCIMFSFG